MAEYFPSVPIREGTGEHDTLLSIGKARRLLGYAPAWSWRDILAVPAGSGPPHEERRR
jgi:nucleoside-diphosphate-sugar epimerase